MCKKIKKFWKKTLTFTREKVIIKIQSRETETSLERGKRAGKEKK